MYLITQNTEAYASMISKPESSVLARLNRDTYARMLRPRMLAGHLQGRLLEMISRMVKPNRVLEIGTYTGYSAICLAAGLADNGLVHTIDINPELEDFARKYIEEAGLGNKITLHFGHALEVIPTIHDVFDIVFIDADKEHYIEYFDLAFQKLRSGGIILADNVLWDGKVVALSEELERNLIEDTTPGSLAADPETMALYRFNEYVSRHDGIDNLLLPFRDGLMICIKK